MKAGLPVRFGYAVAGAVLALSALVIIALCLDLSPSEPVWCGPQREALAGIATALGALAMAITALLILRQVELQNDQLAYYYQPGVDLQVDFVPGNRENADSNGVPVKFVTANQAAVFKLEVWPDTGKVDPMRDMVSTKPQALAYRDGPGMWWDFGMLRPNEERWALLGPRDEQPDRQTLIVTWHHVSADEWRQEWELWKGADGGWCTTPLSVAVRQRRSERRRRGTS